MKEGMMSLVQIGIALFGSIVIALICTGFIWLVVKIIQKINKNA